MENARYNSSIINPIKTKVKNKIMNKQETIELEAAAFRRLVEHFRTRTDVQNIDMMNLAGFCRNCLSKWYLAAAEDRDLEMDYDKAREIVYGMPYSEWKEQYQKEASADQLKAFDESIKEHERK